MICTHCGEISPRKAVWQHEGGVCMMSREDRQRALQRKAGRTALDRAGIKPLPGVFDEPVTVTESNESNAIEPEESNSGFDRKAYQREYMRNRRKAAKK